jgi:5-methylcytosine-specific restriction endonuclease McrA
MSVLKHSKKTKEKIRKAMLKRKETLGYINSPKTRKKLRENHGPKFHTEKSKLKVSKNRKGKCLGVDNPNWKGGKSFEAYTIDWTETLKRSIRERDRYTCQICRKPQGDIVLDVHHIDCNKKNNNPDNLITLCRSCHQKLHNPKSSGEKNGKE